MVSLVIYGLIAIALAASAGYAFLTFTSSSRQLTQLQENQVRMETATAALRASLLALNSNGVLFAPAGLTPTGGYTQLPATLGVVSSTPWGQPYLYCPVSQTGAANPLASSGTASTVKSPSGATYATTVYSSSITQNIPYVITNATTNAVANDSGYVAFIVSSLGPGQTVPDCSKVVVTSPTGSNLYGGLSVPNGSVRGVTAGFPFNQRVIASSDRTEFYVGTTTSGNNSGQDVNNLTTLDNALAFWQALQPRLTTIYLEGGGSYSTTNTLNGETVRTMAQGENTSLVIMTDPNSTSQASLTLASPTPVVLTSYTTFQNLAVLQSSASTTTTVITAYKPFTLRNSSYQITGAAAGIIALYNTAMTVTDSSLVGATINGANSSLEFLNDTGTAATYSNSNTTIGGNLMRVSFDSTGAATTYYFPEGNGNNTTPPINLAASIVNVGSTSTLQTFASAPGIELSASTLNVSGVLNIRALGNVSGFDGGVVAVDGSSVAIASGATATMTANGQMNNGILVRGSSLGISGTVSSVNSGQATIGAQEATVTGTSTGSIVVPTQSVACIQVLNQGGKTGFNNIPLFIFANASYPGDATFNDSVYGYPLLLAYEATNPVIDTPAAAALTPAANKDPFVMVQSQPTSFPSGPYYVDPTTLEASIRSVTNAEFISGLHLSFRLNGCHT